MHPDLETSVYVSVLLALVKKAQEEALSGARFYEYLALSMRQDAADPKDITALVERIRAVFGNEDAMRRVAQTMVQRVNAWNRKQFQRVVKSVTGVDPFTGDLDLTAVTELSIATNVQMIKTLSEKAAQDVALALSSAHRGDMTMDELRALIKSKLLGEQFAGNAARQAALIARDQVIKLNADLTRARQEHIGIDDYYWRTCEDDRVRPTHAANNGKRFSWKRPPRKTGHPGHDVNCRCWAEPAFDGLLEALTGRRIRTPA